MYIGVNYKILTKISNFR